MQRILLGAAIFVAVHTAQPVWPASSAAQDTRDAELAGYDAKLNETYRAIMAELGEDGQDKLRQAQRAWIRMRDFDCEWAFIDARDCLIDRTINRESELRRSYFMARDGEYRMVGR